MFALLARTDSVHPPLPGPSMLEMELRAAIDHLGLPVALAGVDVVLPAVFHFLDVDVGAEPEDVGVPGAQACGDELGERHPAIRSPLSLAGVPDVERGGDLRRENLPGRLRELL